MNKTSEYEDLIAALESIDDTVMLASEDLAEWDGEEYPIVRHILEAVDALDYARIEIDKALKNAEKLANGEELTDEDEDEDYDDEYDEFEELELIDGFEDTDE